MSEGQCSEVQGMIKAIFLPISLLKLRCLHTVRACVPLLSHRFAASPAAAGSCYDSKQTLPRRANNASALLNRAAP